MNTAGTGTRSRVLPSIPVPPQIIKICDVGMEAGGGGGDSKETVRANHIM